MKLPFNGKIVVGLDLSDTYSQISYANIEEQNVETISAVAGQEVYNIPTVLCKRQGYNQWYYGKEALRYQDEGILVENLLHLAISGEPLQIDGSSLQPEALLTLYVKRCLGLLSQVVAVEKIGALMITCKQLDGRTIDVLSQVVAGLSLRTDKIFFQSHVESYYYYMLRQPEELWSRQALLCEYIDNGMCVKRMECNRRTTPVVVYIKEEKYPFLSYGPIPEGESLLQKKKKQLDEEFLQLLESICQGQMISSVYLIGEQFAGEWMQESLRYLCKGRRAFQGNNLYSKGACFGLLEKIHPSEIGKGYVFLGKDKLKINVGMKIMRRGQASYYALLDAGVNWYEAERNLEFYLQEGNHIELLLTSMIGENSRREGITLEGLPEGPCRLRMNLYLKDDTHLSVRVEDLGFGVFRPTTEQIWEEELELLEK